MASSTQASQSVVIIGAGIIGVATAYHLSLLAPSSQIHLVESSPTLFASASGKAAGFLARDWFAPATASLGRLSFDLHKQLADEHDGGKAWGYSPSTAFSLPEVAAGKSGGNGEDWLFEGTSRALMAGAQGGGGAVPQWLAAGRDIGGDGVETISTGSTTAQVDPLLLCQWLLDQCRSRGVHIHHPATPSKVQTSTTNTITGITIRTSPGTEITLPCDTLVLTAGVWTPRVFASLFPASSLTLPITSLSGHSLVLRSPHWAASSAGCHAVFTTDAAAGFSPEIFSRAGGDIYLAGLNSTAIPVPELATDAAPDEADVAVLRRVAQTLLGDAELDVVRAGLCHRPVTRRGVPLLAALGAEKTGVAGKVWVCAGHGPWGISMSLGTGLVLAESILGRETSADVSHLGL